MRRVKTNQFCNAQKRKQSLNSLQACATPSPTPQRTCISNPAPVRRILDFCWFPGRRVATHQNTKHYQVGGRGCRIAFRYAQYPPPPPPIPSLYQANTFLRQDDWRVYERCVAQPDCTSSPKTPGTQRSKRPAGVPNPTERYGSPLPSDLATQPLTMPDCMRTTFRHTWVAIRSRGRA